MDARGQRIIVFGDSLTHHSPDSGPEIWDVDQGSDRSSSEPGDLLASLLLEQGADAVRTNARVGRSAFNFWQRENTSALLASDQAFAPTKVVIILGTNDADSGVNVAVDANMMAQIKSAYEDMGAEVWAIGPVTYNNDQLNAKSGPIVDMMQSLFGGRFIDGRPLSVQVGRAGDGVHFGSDSARQTALNMAAALIETPSPKSWLTWLVIGAGALVVGGLAYSWWKHGGRGYAFPQLGAGFNGYRVAYLTDGAKRTLDDNTFETKEAAQRHMNAYKRRGMTTWVEDDSGAFVPVKGAMRQPKALGAPKEEDEPGTPAWESKTWPVRDKFRQLIRDPDPASMAVAEDLLLENGLKLSDVAAVRGSRGRGRRGVFHLEPHSHVDKPTNVHWDIDTVGVSSTPKDNDTRPRQWDGQFEVVFEGRRITWPRYPDQKDPKLWTDHWRSIITGTPAQAKRFAASDAWAIAKAIKALPRDASDETVRKTVVSAIQDTPTQIDDVGELYGNGKISWPSLSMTEAERRRRARERQGK